MATVTCKYCAQPITVEKPSGTVFCPQCQKAFWAGGSPETSRGATRIETRVPVRSGTGVFFILIGCGLLFFSAAAYVYKTRGDGYQAGLVERRASLEKQLEASRTAFADQSTRTSAFDKQLYNEKARAEDLRVRLYQSLLNPALASPQPAPDVQPVQAVQAVQPVQPASILPVPGTEVTDVVAKRTKSVVVIRGDRGIGSGFVVSGDGIVVTNKHVVKEFASSLQVEMQRRDSSDKIVLKANVIALDSDADLALIKLPPAPPGIAVNGKYPVTPIRTTQVKAGEKVMAIGSPGLETKVRIVVLDYTVTRGVVSMPERILNKMKLIQTTAIVNPGNSGGPLLDEQGDLVGVVTLKSYAAEDIGYALPVETLNALLERHNVSIEKK